MDLAEDGFEVFKDLFPTHNAGDLLTVSVEKEESGEEINTAVLLSEVGIEILVFDGEVVGHSHCILPEAEGSDFLFDQTTGWAPLLGE